MRKSRDDNEKIKFSNTNERITYSYDKSKRKLSDINNTNVNNSYYYISGIKRNGQPDILYDSLFIRGKDYKVKVESEISSEKTDEEICKKISKNSEETYESEENEDCNYLIKSNSLRYFNPVQCDRCSGPHSTIACDIPEEEFCYRCLRKDHIMIECKNFKCFRCNKFGHRIHECKSKDDIKCHRCNLLGHYQDDCLKFPIFKENVNSEYSLKLEKNKSSLSHFQSLKKIFILDERIITDNILQNLANNINCPFCAEKHSLEKCNKFVNRDIREKNHFKRPNIK